MVIALTVLATLIVVGVFMLILGVGGIYMHQKKIMNAVNKPQDIDVKLDYPAEMMMAMMSKIEGIEQTIVVIHRLLELYGSMYLVQLSSQLKDGYINKEDAEELGKIYGAIAAVLRYINDCRKAAEQAEKDNIK